MDLRPTHAKKIILMFWGTWSALVFASNLMDGLQVMGFLPEGFRFVSGNFGAIQSVVEIYGTPAFVAVLFFGTVIIWDALNSFLFWRAGLSNDDFSVGDYSKADSAFTVSLSLWAAMMIADEFFLSFQAGSFEGTHRAIFVALIVSYLAVRMLPED
jgi:hypothetical protein